MGLSYFGSLLKNSSGSPGQLDVRSQRLESAVPNRTSPQQHGRDCTLELGTAFVLLQTAGMKA